MGYTQGIITFSDISIQVRDSVKWDNLDSRHDIALRQASLGFFQSWSYGYAPCYLILYFQHP